MEKYFLLADEAGIDHEFHKQIAREAVWIATDEELITFAQLIMAECFKEIRETFVEQEKRLRQSS